ncbi:Serine protease 42 [Bulinus truncatus]|nr:Serine protease 42 [Bulinus truncatus]
MRLIWLSVILSTISSHLACSIKKQWRHKSTVEYYKQIYQSKFNNDHQGQTYNISDRYAIEIRYIFKTPCGNMDYDPGSAIVDGADAPEKAWPWHVWVYSRYNECGGVLIDSEWVLTAAHCIKLKDKMYSVYLGTHKKQFVSNPKVLRAKKVVFMHEQFDPITQRNDNAMIKLEKPVEFTEKIRPACLPVYRQEFILNNHCYITGWGIQNKPTYTNALQQLKVDVVPNSECEYLWQLRNVTLHGRTLCAGRVRQKGGACTGDSGGPLSCKIGDKYYVAGIILFGPKCSSVYVPDVYTDVGAYIDWIFHTMQKFKD